MVVRCEAISIGCWYNEGHFLVFRAARADAHNDELVCLWATAFEDYVSGRLGSGSWRFFFLDLGGLDLQRSSSAFYRHCLSHKKRGLDYQPPFCHSAGGGVVLD